jgi:hypothetical protein
MLTSLTLSSFVIASNLDMAPFLVKSKVKRPENANTLYDLFAIVRHIGKSPTPDLITNFGVLI